MASQCKHHGCTVSSPSKMKKNGYCKLHSPNQAGIDAEAILKENESLTQRVLDLETENADMKSVIKKLCGAVDNIHALLNLQRSSINSSSYERDNLEQYGRKESLRIINVPEEKLEYDENGKIKDQEDCAEVIISAAATVDVAIKKSDIQRVHRVGKRKKPIVAKNGNVINPKPRPIIVRMKDYNQRQSILKNKRVLQDNAKERHIKKFESAFMVEDLTPLKSKLLWYAKNHCNKYFSNCHTKDGKILAQTPTSKANEWVSLSTPDDFFKHGIDVDIDVINDRLYRVNVLKHLNFPKYSDLLL